MRVGGMRHKIVRLQKSVVKNGFGELVETWGTFGSVVRAQVTKASGTQALERGEVTNPEAIKIQVWGHVAINEKNRISWRGEIYGVDFIEPSYDDRVKVLNCNKIND